MRSLASALSAASSISTSPAATKEGRSRTAANADPSVLAKDALQKLSDLIARYADPEMPYEVKRRRGPFARAYDYDDYEHLARVKEWLTQEAEEEFR